MVWIRLARPNHIKSESEGVYERSRELHIAGPCLGIMPPDLPGATCPSGLVQKGKAKALRRPGPTQGAVVPGGLLLASSCSTPLHPRPSDGWKGKPCQKTSVHQMGRSPKNPHRCHRQQNQPALEWRLLCSWPGLKGSCSNGGCGMPQPGLTFELL